MSELRKCKASIKGEDVECLFHCFSVRSEVIQPSIMIGGHTGGNVQYPVALVELHDGSMVELPAFMIRFIDKENK